jgi:hypothetical protein
MAWQSEITEITRSEPKNLRVPSWLNLMAFQIGLERKPASPSSGRRDLFEGVVVIVPARGMANRKDSPDRTFRLVHVHNVRRRRHDVVDAVKNQLTNLRR